MPRIELNIEAAILRSLVDLIERQNAVSGTEPGAPRVHIAATSEDLVHAASVMTQAFVRNGDKAWIAWLRPADVQRIRAGDFVDAEKKISRVIHYLLQAAFRTGGVVVLETAHDELHGGRTVRGAALRTLPSAVLSTCLLYTSDAADE